MSSLFTGKRKWRSLWQGALYLLAILLITRAAAAQNSKPDVEQQVKAAYLYKFGSYVEWPDSAFSGGDNTLKIGIVGANSLADELMQVTAGRTVNGRPISIRKLRPGEAVTGFNVLFIGAASNDKLADILAATKGTPTLTVTESGEGLALGSVINFVLVDGKLRFEVAPKTAHQGNLNISARLLAAALKVGGG